MSERLKLFIPCGKYIMRLYLSILQYFIRLAECAVGDKVLSKKDHPIFLKYLVEVKEIKCFRTIERFYPVRNDNFCFMFHNLTI